MRSGLVKWYVAAFAAVALLHPALAEEVAIGNKSCAPACPPACPAPACPAPAPLTIPTPPETTPTPPTPTPPAAQEPSSDPLAFGATGGGESFAAASSAVGYIDQALPVSQIRFRSDNAYDSNRPDRAEFFYAKCGCLVGLGQLNAKGPPQPESRINSYQDLSAYVEWAPIQRLSGFIEVPYRFINPDANANTNGFSDINAGFKYAWIYDSSRIVTTQVRVYTPTGDSQAGLGTHHATIEPALLFYQRLSDRWNLEGEVRDWIPVGGSDFAGNILRYGIGTSYMVWANPCQTIKVYPVVEFVGWSVLSGQESTLDGAIPIKSAAGETIVNGKFGVRTQLGKPVNGLMSRADVYLGYGRALTGDFWYKDIVRAELRIRY